MDFSDLSSTSRPGTPSFDPDLYDHVVEDLAIPHRRQAAERRLLEAGSAATKAVRGGLEHDDPRVRASCCRVLDHFLDEEALPGLVANLEHADESVRAWALHALGCDQCKEGSCRPVEEETLPIAMQMLVTDPARSVRAQALRLVAPAVHRHPEVIEILERVRREDASPAMRKAAAWWVPGGPRYERTKVPARRHRAST